MTPKQPQQYSVVVVSTTVHYLGALRSFLGEERVETSPKLSIWITYVAWFLNFGQPLAITWLNFAQFHLPVPVLKTTKHGKPS